MELPQAPPIRYATASDGTQIAYMRYPGESPPFLSIFTPGSPSITHKARQPTYVDGGPGEFSRGRSWIWFDWRGTGLSGPIRGPLTTDQLCLDIDAVAASIGEQVDGWTVANACFLACAHAASRPGKYRSLWLRSPAVRYIQDWDHINRPGWDANYREHLRVVLHSLGASHSHAVQRAREWEEEVPLESMRAYFDLARQSDMLDVLPRLTLPVWVTAAIAPHEGPAAEVAALLPNATLSIWKSASIGSHVGDWNRDDWDRNLGCRLGDVVEVQPAPTTELSPRELDVLRLAACGRTNAEIAESLSLSPRTVERHLENIYRKTGLKNRAAVAAWAVRNGLA